MDQLYYQIYLAPIIGLCRDDEQGILASIRVLACIIERVFMSDGRRGNHTPNRAT